MIDDLGVIIAAGGSSLRYGEKDKLLEELGGMPVFLHSVRNFLPVIPPGNMVIAVRQEALGQYQELAGKFLPQAKLRWVPGGSSRVASVINALNALPMTGGLVAIHDAARPLATADLLIKVAERAAVSGGAIAASKVTDSLKLADDRGFILSPVSREAVYHAETPQIFDLKKYRAACNVLQGGDIPTDDAEIMRQAGFPVELVDSDQLNIKLTSPDDLAKLQRCLPGN